MWSSTCPSAKRLEGAAGTIMESIYRISSTSFDILLLDHYSSFCWFMAGMALVRILKSKIDAGAHIEVIKVNSEIEVIKHILLRLSERTIIGRRQIKLLNEHFDNEIGIQSFQSQANTTELDPISGRPKKRTKVSEMLNIAQGTKIGPGMATFDGPIRLR
ncbi:hypothetical protein FRB99_004408 [Tulasnella sp. 403]|nr:hypothetical protein FRB99_004408 [Tulasnella sp. 403]